MLSKLQLSWNIRGNAVPRTKSRAQSRSTIRCAISVAPSSPSMSRSLPCHSKATSSSTICHAISRINPKNVTVTDEAKVGAFSDAEFEHVAPTTCLLEGQGAPDWLRGSLLRNGPGIVSPFVHMFDGYSMLFKAHFDQGTVKTSYRFLQSEAYKAYKRTGRPQLREFATPVRYKSQMEGIVTEVVKTIGTQLGLTNNVSDNASVCIVPFAPGKALAVTETIRGTYIVDTENLETVSAVKYSDGVKGDLTTAHYARDVSGHLVNITSDVGSGFNVYRQAPGSLDREVISSIPHRYPTAPAWVHSFPCSGRHAVIPEFPATFQLDSLITGKDSTHYFLKWKPSDGTLFHVVALNEGRTVTFGASAFFSFHQVNAYEDEARDVLVVDLSAYDNLDAVTHLTLDNMRSQPDKTGTVTPCFLQRIEFPLGPLRDGTTYGGSLPAPRNLVDPALIGNFFEFPAINPDYVGRKNRYTWAVCATQPTNVGNTLCKVDIDEGTVKTWRLDGSIPGEPIFVPRPGATAEDDGVILAVLSGADGLGKVVVLDGATMEALGVYGVPHAVPYQFHGSWFPSV